MNERLNVGGQAVIEGVMIIGPGHYSIAVRNGKKIIAKSWKLKKGNHRLLKLPFVRGFANLARMLAIGIKSLVWSAQQAGQEDEKIGKHELGFAVLTAFLFAVAVFIALPYFLTSLIGLTEESKPLLFNLVDGIIRILIFLAYLAVISLMKDVKVLFEYHGAEHKAIHCYEKGRKLTVENVGRFTTLHPRCGTSFLLTVFIVGILVFSVIPSLILYLNPDFLQLGFWTRKILLLAVRLAMVPVIAGISYEILKLSDKKQHNVLFRIVSAPGILLQKITTREPSYRQIEVAIASLKTLLETENKK